MIQTEAVRIKTTKSKTEDKMLKEEIHKTEEAIQDKEEDSSTTNQHQTVEETHSCLKSELESITTSTSCFVMLRIQFQRPLVTSWLRRVKILSNLSFTTLLTAISNSNHLLVNQPV